MRIVIPDIRAVSKVLLAIFPITWLPPIIDLVVSRGSGYRIAYIFATGSSLWGQFLTLGGSFALGGVTTGVKTELLIILAGIFFYVFTKTRSVGKAIGLVILSYVLIFILVSLPSILAVIGNASSPFTFLTAAFSSSRMMGNFIRPTVQISYGYALERVFNLGMAQLYYLIDLALVAGWLIAYRPQAALMFWKNARLNRLAHFMFMICFGFFLAVIRQHVAPFLNWIDVVSFAGLLVSYVCAWFFAVGVNDEVDIAIDRVSNAGRPLVAGTLSVAEMRAGTFFFFVWALLGGYLGGYWTFFAVGVFLAAYYIYSAPPLRLKQIPLLATFLISIACLSAAMAGFFFASSDKYVLSFPISVLALIVIFFTLFINVKDVKDIEGDRAAGIPTIPVVVGERYGREAVGALLVIAFLAVPIVTGVAVLFWPSLVAAVLGYAFVVKKPYKEWRLFAVYFVYAAVVGFMIWPR